MTLLQKTLALVALLALGACETVGGAGQDIENTGEFIEGAAADVQASL